MRFILKNPVKLDVSAIQQSCGTEYRMTTVLVCIWTKRCVSSHFHQQLSSYVLLPSPWLLTLCCMHVPLCGVRKSGAEADTQTVRCDVLLVTSNPWANVIPYYCVSLASLWCISMQCRGDEVKKKISTYSSFFDDPLSQQVFLQELQVPKFSTLKPSFLEEFRTNSVPLVIFKHPPKTSTFSSSLYAH